MADQSGSTDAARPTAATRGLERHRPTRRRHTRLGHARHVALLCVAAVIGSLLVLPVVSITQAPPASAADVPICPPGTTSSTANCLPPDNIPDGTDTPPKPVLSPPRPYQVPGWVEQTFTITGPVVGGDCPPGSVPWSRLPCTRPGVGGGVTVFDNTGGSEAGQLGTYGIYLGGATASENCSGTLTHSCTLALRYDPKAFTGSLTLILYVSSTILGDLNGDGNVLDSVGYSVTMTVTGTGSQPPTADFEFSGAGTATDQMFFMAKSTDPGGSPMTHTWDFGDGGTATGTPVVYSWAKPGDYDVTLTSTNLRGQTATKTRKVTVKAAGLGLSIELLDGAAPPLAPGEPVRARVNVSAADGLGAINNIRFSDDSVLHVSPGDAFLITDGPTPPVPTGGFSLQPGETRSFDVTIEPQLIGRYTMSSQVTGTDAAGVRQTADASSPGEIGDALKIAIALDPPNADQDEGPDGPIPVDVTATITFENTTPIEMDAVTMTSLRVDRTKAGQLLAVTQTGGADPGDDGLSIGALAPGQKKTVTATFRATDDAEVDFSVLATAHTVDGATQIGRGVQRWSVKPKYLLGLTTRVTNPAGTALLPAGELIRVAGTVKNLSTTATLEVGPLYPTLSGNAGVMSLAWDGTGTDPNELIAVGNITLEPGESRDFTVRILTTWSDPRRISGPGGSGGTQANLTFTPYGKATLEDGTEVAIEPDDIKAAESDLTHRVAIDDSISIPSFSGLTWWSSLAVGTVQGLGNAAASTVTGVVDLVKAPYTITSAVYAAQAQIWDSFTPEEQAEFADDVGLMAAAILMRNAEYAKEGSAALVDRISESSLTIMTDLENEWRIGDYTQTVQRWSSWYGDAIGQVVIPVALARMAKSPRVVAALARAQAELQTRMAPVLSSSLSATRLEELGPLLAELASGTEVGAAEMAQLYGVSAEEYGELKRLADKYGVLLTVRSRHASSIEWIERFQAMLKPETLKIKSVSELDEALGWPADTVGSLVFQKPEPLKVFESGAKDLGPAIIDFVNSKGFTPGTVEWQNAIKRMADRSVEWRKWEKTYKQWDAQGWIDVSLNYEGNAITDPIRKGRSGIGVAPLSSGKYEQFRLRKIGEDQYIVEMYNNKVGRFVPVTGDIDPIAFTHLDGSPLTVEEHANLLDDMARNPALQAQHGESATYTKGGLDFIESQFKPGEPGLQIAPGDSAARVVRFNKGDSRWSSAEDYHLKWDGGFTYSGSYVPRTAIPQAPVVVPAAVAAPVRRVSAIPKAVGPGPNVGRCRITYGTAVGNSAAVVDANGKLRRLAGDGTPDDSDESLDDECFSEGPMVEVELKPVTGLTTDEAEGATELEIPDDPFLAEPGTDIDVGDTIVVGAGTAEAETHTVTGFGSILIDAGLQRAWPAGTLIVVVKAGDPVTPPTTTPVTTPVTTPSTTPPPATTPPTTAAPTTATPTTPTTAAPASATPGAEVAGATASRSSGARSNGSSSGGADAAQLALTGGETRTLLPFANVLLALGLLFVGLSRARRVRFVRVPEDD